MSKLTVGKFELSEADIDNEVELEAEIGSDCNYVWHYINENEAIQIIKHLKEQLNITDEQIKGEEHE